MNGLLHAPEILLPAGLVVLLAYFIRGISGFGSGLIAVPLLAHILPLTFVVPLILVTDFAASLAMSLHVRRHTRWDEIRPLLPFSFAGVLAGTLLLINLPRAPLLAVLGGLVLLFGLRSILDLHGTAPVSRRWAAPAGIVGGTISGLFGTGGPPYVIYLNHRLRDKGELRASFTGLFLIEGGMRLVLFLAAGLFFEADLLLTLITCLPVMALGLYLGNHVHIGLSQSQMQRLIGALLLASGGSLVWRALA